MRDASQGYGFDINKWYFEKPDEFNINPAKFQELIDRLEKDEIIKRASKEPINYYISDKGKRELTTLKKQLKFKEYYLIISNFPVIELKERVGYLENFIILSISLVVMIGLNSFVSQHINNISYLILFLFFSLFIFIVSFYVGFNLGSIVLFWIISMQKETLWKYKEWLWNNQNKIIGVISVLFIIFIIFLLDYMQLSKLKDSIVIIVLGLIVYWISERKKINEQILLKFRKNMKPP